MDAGEFKPAGIEKSKAALPLPERNSIASRFLVHISRETSSGRFIPEMDGLRFAAVAMVILYHLNGYLTAKSPFYSSAPPSSDWLAQAAMVGNRGVELFFVISGFILGLPFAAHYLKGAAPVNLRKYYLRRLTRLEPPYFVALLLLFIMGAVILGFPSASFYPHFAASLFYSHSLIYGTFSPAMGVAWSLEIEVQFYLLVPLLTLLFTIGNRMLRRVCDCRSYTGCLVGTSPLPARLSASLSSRLALDSRVCSIFSGRIPAGRRFSGKLGRSSAAKSGMGRGCAGGMAAVVCAPPFAGADPLAVSRMDLSSLLRRVSRPPRQSFLLQSLDHSHWRDVLLDLPAAL